MDTNRQKKSIDLRELSNRIKKQRFRVVYANGEDVLIPISISAHAEVQATIMERPNQHIWKAQQLVHGGKLIEGYSLRKF